LPIFGKSRDFQCRTDVLATALERIATWSKPGSRSCWSTSPSRGRLVPATPTIRLYVLEFGVAGQARCRHRYTLRTAMRPSAGGLETAISSSIVYAIILPTRN